MTPLSSAPAPRTGCAGLALLVFLGATLPPDVLFGQTGRFDIDVPEIRHMADEQPVPGTRQVFDAIVTDDGELQAVTLHYRIGREGPFRRTLMRPLGGGANWRAAVALPSGATELEYYIEAKDATGNRVWRGMAFAPLLRRVAATSPGGPFAPGQADRSERSGSATAQVPAHPDTRGSFSSIWWYVAGALAIGALAAAAADGSGDDDSPTGGPAGDDPSPDDCCRVVIAFDEP